ncbi:calponin homology domain-containing protein DDB_G0272472-like [Vanessa cardui]|uniref:calponin homology domain-containing protein DDB_G0272472-like n=1 Tax=Vanessa cardui TaxID=171605 RepID=UPI001F143821|nr:calponin homology domain-containing protein DDB_G0272472-like [Vanessa cardui]
MVSWTAVTLLAGDPPWEPQADVLAEVYRFRVEARNRAGVGGACRVAGVTFEDTERATRPKAAAPTWQSRIEKRISETRVRQHCETETVIDVNEMKKTIDIVDYDKVHMQKAIVNRAEEKRREKLKNILQKEEYELDHELYTKRAMQECKYCTERDSKIKKYEEEIEREKERNCLKALEREKIANGMRCTKSDEIKLREMQKMQMQEKANIEKNKAEVDELWHEVLMNDLRRKEEIERIKSEKRKREMFERRMAYDKQITSANRQRQEALQTEREVENRRLENLKKKMEQDYYDAIKRKKDQQMLNKKNFIEGYDLKQMEIRNKKRQEREMDVNTILIAMEELRKERQRELDQIQALKIEKQVFVENYNRERKMADQLERDAETITTQWKEQREKESDEINRQIEKNKWENKTAAQEYKRHIEERNRELEKKRQERRENMERVKRTAYNELRNNLNSANEEMRRQIEYRNALTNQIRDNGKILELELNGIERKQRPFTKKAIMFKEAMKNKIEHSSVR